MPCTCNAICDNDCGSNQLCTGHATACINTWSFSWTPSGSGIIKGFHVVSLGTAINQERVNALRRFNASDPAYCSTHTPGNVACTSNVFLTSVFASGGGPILVGDHDDIKDAINEVTNNSGYGGLVTANFIAQSADVSVGKIDSVVKAINVLELQTKINETRNACICDSHCNCDPSDCGCNGECPSDDYYYYYA